MRIIYFFALFLMSYSLSAADDYRSIEGRWYNKKYDIYILVDYTEQGIRVQRGDQRDWYYYRLRGADQYVDPQGNKYLVRSSGEVIFSPVGRGHILYFQPATRSRRAVLPERRYDYQYDRYTGPELEGRWSERRTGRIINVNERRRGIDVRFDRREVYFRFVGYNRFRDRDGNEIILERDGDLVYRDFRGRQRRLYRRSDRARRYCD